MNGSGFTTASQHAAELQYIFNFGAAFTAAQAKLATDIKTYWANFVKTGNPNGRFDDDDEGPRAQPSVPFWPHFNTGDDDDESEADSRLNQVEVLTPPGLLTPQGPHPFDTFTTEHFCATWEPLLTFDNGNEPQQP